MYTHFLLKCLGNDACVKLSGFVWVGFVHAKVTVLTWVYVFLFKEVEIRDIEETTQVPVHFREQACLNASYTNSYLTVSCLFFFLSPLFWLHFILLGGWYPSNMSLLIYNSERSHSWSPWAKQVYDEGCSCAVRSEFSHCALPLSIGVCFASRDQSPLSEKEIPIL